MRRLDIDRMREVAECVSIFGDRRRRRDLEAEGDPLLIRRVNWREPYVVMGMRGGMLVNVSSDVFDPKSHTSQSRAPRRGVYPQACEKDYPPDGGKERQREILCQQMPNHAARSLRPGRGRRSAAAPARLETHTALAFWSLARAMEMPHLPDRVALMILADEHLGGAKRNSHHTARPAEQGRFGIRTRQDLDREGRLRGQ